MSKFKSFIRYDLPVLGRMAAPAIFIIAVSLRFHEFIVEAILANKAINLGILFAAGCGMAMIFTRLIEQQRDMRALDRFSREAVSGRDMKELLEEPWLKGLAICHYLEHLAHTEGKLATQLDQDAIQIELQALLEEYNSKMEMPQFLVGFMVAMGLLGTFIGLLETLTGISGMLDGMGGGGDLEAQFSKLVVELRKPLAGMGIAFSASMFGLVTSLMLAIMMIMLRRYTSRVMEKARSVMHRLLTRIKTRIMEDGEEQPANAFQANQITPGDDLVSAFFKTQDSINAMVNAVNLQTRYMDTLFRLLEANLEQTQQTNELLGFGPRLSEATEQMVREIKVLSGAQDEGQKMIQKIITNLIQIDQSLMSSNPRELLAVQRELNSMITEMFGNAQSQTRLTSENLEAQRETRRDIVNAIRTLYDTQIKQEEAMGGFAKALADIKEAMNRTSGSLTLVDSIAENISKQTQFLELSFADERAQKTAGATLQRDIHDFTETLKSVLKIQEGQ